MSVRQGVFETNSSSVHAIVIDTSGNVDENALFYYDGPVLGFYGRSFKVVGLPEDKISYLWTALWDLKTRYIHYEIDEDSPYAEFYHKLLDLPDLDWWKYYLYDTWSGYYRGDTWISANVSKDSEEYKKQQFQTELPEISEEAPYEYKYLMLHKEVDHANDLITFFERIANDRKLLYDFIFGIGSYVLVTHDEGGYEIDAPKMADADIILKSIEEEEDNCEWSQFHEFPDRDRVIFIKMG